MSNIIVEDWGNREKYEFASQVLQRTANFINSLELQVTEHYNEIETRLEFLKRKMTFLESQARLVVDTDAEQVTTSTSVQPTSTGPTTTAKLNAGEILNFNLKKTTDSTHGSTHNSRNELRAPVFDSIPPPPAFESASLQLPSFNSPPDPPSFEYNQFTAPAPPDFNQFNDGNQFPPMPPTFDQYDAYGNLIAYDEYGNPIEQTFPSFNAPPPPPFQ